MTERRAKRAAPAGPPCSSLSALLRCPNFPHSPWRVDKEGERRRRAGNEGEESERVRKGQRERGSGKREWREGEAEREAGPDEAGEREGTGTRRSRARGEGELLKQTERALYI